MPCFQNTWIVSIMITHTNCCSLCEYCNLYHSSLFLCAIFDYQYLECIGDFACSYWTFCMSFGCGFSYEPLQVSSTPSHACETNKTKPLHTHTRHFAHITFYSNMQTPHGLPQSSPTNHSCTSEKCGSELCVCVPVGRCDVADDLCGSCLQWHHHPHFG